MTAAVLDGVCLRAARRAARRSPRRARHRARPTCIGGGARSPLWSQMARRRARHHAASGRRRRLRLRPRRRPPRPLAAGDDLSCAGKPSACAASRRVPTARPPRRAPPRLATLPPARPRACRLTASEALTMPKAKSSSTPNGWSSASPSRCASKARFTPSQAPPFAYRWYDPDRVVLGKRMEDQLRFAVCWWHSFVWPAPTRSAMRPSTAPGIAAGGDPIGTGAGQGRRRVRVVPPAARALLHLPRPRRALPRVRPCANRTSTCAGRRAHAAKDGRRRGEAALGHGQPVLEPRYLAGAATNPDPEVFAYAARR
jgi:hypothetical protein